MAAGLGLTLESDLEEDMQPHDDWLYVGRSQLDNVVFSPNVLCVSPDSYLEVLMAAVSINDLISSCGAPVTTTVPFVDQ